jgi:hypothetical protein
VIGLKPSRYESYTVYFYVCWTFKIRGSLQLWGQWVAYVPDQEAFSTIPETIREIAEIKLREKLRVLSLQWLNSPKLMS